MEPPAAGAQPLVVVKLGGSVITRKREVERIRAKVLDRLCRELAAPGAGRLIVLHGAGSFGHPGARRFGLARAPESGVPRERRARGAAIVASEVRRLHTQVLRALVHSGISAISVPIATHARNRAGRLATFDPQPFLDALQRGTVPVSFGDVVPDDVWGFSILSADTIATELAGRLHPDRVVFVSDVVGILGRPTGGKRPVVSEVTDAVVAALRPASGAPDVTGGIRGKAEAMRAIARGGTDAGLISGLTDGALSRAIRGESVYGSWARAEAH
jgi:isopentenyl phosphate kinase